MAGPSVDDILGPAQSVDEILGPDPDRKGSGPTASESGTWGQAAAGVADTAKVMGTGLVTGAAKGLGHIGAYLASPFAGETGLEYGDKTKAWDKAIDDFVDKYTPDALSKPSTAAGQENVQAIGNVMGAVGRGARAVLPEPVVDLGGDIMAALPAAGVAKIPGAIAGAPEYAANVGRGFNSVVGDAWAPEAAAAPKAAGGASADLQAALSDRGAAANPTAAKNYATAERINPNFKPTAGEAADDVDQLRAEINNGDSIPGYSAQKDANRNILRSEAQGVRNAVAPNAAADNPTVNSEQIQHYEDHHEATRAAIDDLYAHARAQVDPNTPMMDPQSLRGQIAAATQWHPQDTGAVGGVLNNLDRMGNQPMTVAQFEQMRTHLATMAREGQGSERAAASDMRDVLEQHPVLPQAGNIGDIFNDARAAAAKDFENQRIDPAYKAVVQGKANPTNFMETYTKTPQGVRAMQTTLAGNQDAVDNIGAHLVDRYQELTRMRQTDSGGTPPAGGEKFLSQRMPALQQALPPEAISRLQDLQAGAKMITPDPRRVGASTSNSASPAVAAIKGGVSAILNKMTGGALGATQEGAGVYAAQKLANSTMGRYAGLDIAPKAEVPPAVTPSSIGQRAAGEAPAAIPKREFVPGQAPPAPEPPPAGPSRTKASNTRRPAEKSEAVAKEDQDAVPAGYWDKMGLKGLGQKPASEVAAKIAGMRKPVRPAAADGGDSLLNSPMPKRELPGTFASRVQDIANQTQSGKLSNQALISHVYENYKAAHPDAGTLDEFKQRLVEAGRARGVDLGRVTLAENVDRAAHRASQTVWDKRFDDRVDTVMKKSTGASVDDLLPPNLRKSMGAQEAPQSTRDKIVAAYNKIVDARPADFVHEEGEVPGEFRRIANFTDIKNALPDVSPADIHKEFDAMEKHPQAQMHGPNPEREAEEAAIYGMKPKGMSDWRSIELHPDFGKEPDYKGKALPEATEEDLTPKGEKDPTPWKSERLIRGEARPLGHPLEVRGYRGTPDATRLAENAAGDRPATPRGQSEEYPRGVYFATDPSYATTYQRNGLVGFGDLHAANLRLKNPLYLKEGFGQIDPEMEREVRAAGYDSVMGRTKAGHMELAVLDPEGQVQMLTGKSLKDTLPPQLQEHYYGGAKKAVDTLKGTAASPGAEAAVSVLKGKKAAPTSDARPATLKAADKAEGHKLVTVDTKSLNDLWQKDKGYAFSSLKNMEDEGGSTTRYTNAKKKYQAGTKMDAPSVAILRNGDGSYRAAFNDGRHRFMAMRELDDAHVRVAMDPDSAKLAKQLGITR